MSKKLWVLLSLMFSVHLMDGQNNADYTISFDSISLKEAILQLENESGMSFYFDESWLEDAQVTKGYVDQPLSLILDDLFSETAINYFIIGR